MYLSLNGFNFCQIISTYIFTCFSIRFIMIINVLVRFTMKITSLTLSPRFFFLYFIPQSSISVSPTHLLYIQFTRSSFLHWQRRRTTQSHNNPTSSSSSWYVESRSRFISLTFLYSIGLFSSSYIPRWCSSIEILWFST